MVYAMRMGAWLHYSVGKLNRSPKTGSILLFMLIFNYILWNIIKRIKMLPFHLMLTFGKINQFYHISEVELKIYITKRLFLNIYLIDCILNNVSSLFAVWKILIVWDFKNTRKQLYQQYFTPFIIDDVFGCQELVTQKLWLNMV